MLPRDLLEGVLGALAHHRIEDNGIGIDPIHLDRIFSDGFTTKRGGHGFGLHVSIISAHGMGSELHAESEGLSRGAQLVLTVPVAAEDSPRAPGRRPRPGW